MILNPQAVLAELLKYQTIVRISKTALERLRQGEAVDDLKDVLKVKLDECGFTQMNGSGSSEVPLFSVTRYLDNRKVLEEQIFRAEAYVEEVVSKIKKDVGPFYSRDEVKSFKQVSELTLGDQVWLPTLEPIKVKAYLDSKNGIAVQVDWDHGQYRTAKDGQQFGHWKVFTK